MKNIAYYGTVINKFILQLHYITSHHITSHRTTVQYCTVMYCTLLYLYCTVLYSTTNHSCLPCKTSELIKNLSAFFLPGTRVGKTIGSPSRTFFKSFSGSGTLFCRVITAASDHRKFFLQHYIVVL